MRSVTDLQAELGRPAFALGVVAVTWLLCVVVGRLRRRGALRSAGVVSGTALLLTLVGALSLTLLGPEAPMDASRRLFLDPLQGARGWERIAWRPVLDNVVLFVPVGAFAAARWVRMPALLVLIGCVVLSVGIEAFQYLVPTGRVANTADVLANAAGATVGLVLSELSGARRPARAPSRVDAGT